MDNIRPWQVILFVIAVAILGFSLWRSASAHSVPKTNSYMTVDIMTGQLYELRKGKAKGVPLPAKNPDTGERTLYPVNQVDDLIWEIPRGYSSFLSEKVRRGSLLKSDKFKIVALPDKPIIIIVKK